MKSCDQCRKDFTPKANVQDFCSSNCFRAWYKRNKDKMPAAPSWMMGPNAG